MITFGNKSSIITPTKEYLSTQTSATDANTYTFTDVSIGSAHEKRTIVFVITAEPTTTANNVLVCSLDNTIAAQQLIGGFEGTTRAMSRIFAVNMPGEQTTANLTIGFTGSQLQCVVHVYKLTNVLFNLFSGNTSDLVSMTVNVPDNGILIGGALHTTTGASTVVGLTEDYDQTFDSQQFAAGSAGPISAETARLIEFNGASGDHIGAVAVFSPYTG